MYVDWKYFWILTRFWDFIKKIKLKLFLLFFNITLTSYEILNAKQIPHIVPKKKSALLLKECVVKKMLPLFVVNME